MYSSTNHSIRLLLSLPVVLLASCYSMLVFSIFVLLFSPPKPYENSAYHQCEEKAECKPEGYFLPVLTSFSLLCTVTDMIFLTLNID